MSPNTEPPSQNDLFHPQGQHPKLRRLASKPLKLAQSTLRPLTSRSSTTPGQSTVASSSTLVPSDATSINSYSSGSDRKKWRRHHRLKSQPGLTPAQIASAAKGPRKPLDGEEPAAWLRVRIVRADGLVAKDRRGSSDPFITLLLPPSHRTSTSVVKRTLHPVFPAESSTFEYPIHLSLAGVIGGRGLEGVVWDKDLMRKEYMGEVTIPLVDWFEGEDVKLWHEDLPHLTHRLLSTRRRHKVSGTVSLQIGFIEPKNATSAEDALRQVRMVYGALAERSSVGRGRVGVLGVPAHEGIGTIKMRSRRFEATTPLAPSASAVEDKSAFALLHSATAAILSPMAGGQRMSPVPGHEQDDDDDEDEEVLADDGLSSSSDDDYEDALGTSDPGESHEMAIVETLAETIYDKSAGLPQHNLPPEMDDRILKSSGLLTPSRKPAQTPSRQSSMPGYFDRPTHQEYGESPALSVPGTPGDTKRRPRFKRNKSATPSKKSTKDFNFDANQGRDVLGIVMVEIKSAADLPKIKNSLRVSFDMDPFVVVSFGKKVFRTRVIRHSLNPTWDERLIFHVRRHESTFTLQFAVLDWDKVSGNDMVGTCTIPLSQLVADAPGPNAKTGLYGSEEDGRHEMKDFTLSLNTDKAMPWESRHSPSLTVRARYEPYDALRQRFWRQYITQYNADDTGKVSYTELTTMLDSLGSTLTKETLEGYFSSCGKDAEKDELTVEEVILCLEREVAKDRSEKAKVSDNDLSISVGHNTPGIAAHPSNHGLEMTGPHIAVSSAVNAQELAEHIIKSAPREQQKEDDDQGRPGNQLPHDQASPAIPSVKLERSASIDGSATPLESAELVTPPSPSEPEIYEPEPESSCGGDDRERIINIRTCPLCHRPRLGKRSEQDIVTHLAICASADWNRVDRIVTANYVSASQAQRKFFTRMVNKVAIGAYSLGANSANILVQDRTTGQLQEEKMAVYVRVGIRVLYKGAKSRMEGGRARRLLKSLSVKQGLKYDSPASAIDIPSFIAFHGLDVNEILDPIDSFRTFNEFFYRKLKPGARPMADPDDPGRLVSCADCRMMAFETVIEATNIWIKGREFTVGRLLGPNYKDVAHRFEGGGLGIFRLAPQDYHRFHSPVKGRVGKMTLIDGEYYTVNPQAIRTSLDVYGENVRKVVPVDSEEFGLVMTVWVGAMMVGSILTTVEEGQMIDRAEEMGYFAFGGSTIVCLFEKGAMHFDEDLVQNGRASIETLVRMGMGIGHATKGRQ